MADHRIVGVDVGLNTPFASCYGSANGLGPHLISTYRIPTTGEDASKRIDVEPFRDWLISTGAALAYIETASAMPAPETGRAQGGGSIARYMRAAGAIEACVILSGLEAVFVPPAVWKRALGLLKADKKDSVRMARRLFPLLAHTTFKYWNSHNAAESALLAVFGASRCGIVELKLPS